MGAIPCYIIITCGGLEDAGSSFASLYSTNDDSSSVARSAAVYLAGTQSSACELAGELAGVPLTGEEKVAIFKQGEEAEALRAEIVAFTRNRFTRHVLADRDKLVGKMNAFADKSHAMFLALVTKYRDA